MSLTPIDPKLVHDPNREPSYVEILESLLVQCLAVATDSNFTESQKADEINRICYMARAAKERLGT